LTSACITGTSIKICPVFENTCATSQKNVKSHVFWIFKKRNHLVMQPLIT